MSGPIRCPYCVEGDNFKLMTARADGPWSYGDRCGHSKGRASPHHQCSCQRCEEINRLSVRSKKQSIRNYRGFSLTNTEVSRQALEFSQNLKASGVKRPFPSFIPLSSVIYRPVNSHSLYQDTFVLLDKTYKSDDRVSVQVIPASCWLREWHSAGTPPL